MFNRKLFLYQLHTLRNLFLFKWQIKHNNILAIYSFRIIYSYFSVMQKMCRKLDDHVCASRESTIVSQLIFEQSTDTYIMRPEDHLFIHRIDLAALAGITQVRVAD